MNKNISRNLDIGILVDTINEAMELGKQLRNPKKWTNKAKVYRFLSKIFQIIALILPIFNITTTYLPKDSDIVVIASIVCLIINWIFSNRSYRIQKKLQVALNPNAGVIKNNKTK